VVVTGAPRKRLVRKGTWVRIPPSPPPPSLSLSRWRQGWLQPRRDELCSSRAGSNPWVPGFERLASLIASGSNPSQSRFAALGAPTANPTLQQSSDSLRSSLSARVSRSARLAPKQLVGSYHRSALLQIRASLGVLRHYRHTDVTNVHGLQRLDDQWMRPLQDVGARVGV
jgi:hypothetical protein